jgi:hypothetical protein
MRDQTSPGRSILHLNWPVFANNLPQLLRALIFSDIIVGFALQKA